MSSGNWLKVQKAQGSIRAMAFNCHYNFQNRLITWTSRLQLPKEQGCREVSSAAMPGLALISSMHKLRHTPQPTSHRLTLARIPPQPIGHDWWLTEQLTRVPIVSRLEADPSMPAVWLAWMLKTTWTMVDIHKLAAPTHWRMIGIQDSHLLIRSSNASMNQAIGPPVVAQLVPVVVGEVLHHKAMKTRPTVNQFMFQSMPSHLTVVDDHPRYQSGTPPALLSLNFSTITLSFIGHNWRTLPRLALDSVSVTARMCLVCMCVLFNQMELRRWVIKYSRWTELWRWALPIEIGVIMAMSESFCSASICPLLSWCTYGIKFATCTLERAKNLCYWIILPQWQEKYSQTKCLPRVMCLKIWPLMWQNVRFETASVTCRLSPSCLAEWPGSFSLHNFVTTIVKHRRSSVIMLFRDISI